MLFNSYDYLLWFLPATLVVFFALGARPRLAQAWLTFASLVVLRVVGPWRYLPLILGSVGVELRDRARAAATAVASAADGRHRAEPRSSRRLQVRRLLPRQCRAADRRRAAAAALVLPLGISFFTFTQIAYLVDVHRRRAQEPVLGNYALFVTFFPHLLAGPILHHSEMMPQFAERSNKRPQAANLASGLFLLTIGLVKKVLIADTFAPIADAGFGAAGDAVGACRVDRGARLHDADLFRFLGLHRHGAGRGAHVQHPDADQFRLAVPLDRHPRILAPLAHHAVALPARVPVHTAGRQSSRRSEDRGERARDLPARRALARRGVDASSIWGALHGRRARRLPALGTARDPPAAGRSRGRCTFLFVSDMPGSSSARRRPTTR